MHWEGGLKIAWNHRIKSDRGLADSRLLGRRKVSSGLAGISVESSTITKEGRWGVRNWGANDSHVSIFVGELVIKGKWGMQGRGRGMECGKFRRNLCKAQKRESRYDRGALAPPTEEKRKNNGRMKI